MHVWHREDYSDDPGRTEGCPRQFIDDPEDQGIFSTQKPFPSHHVRKCIWSLHRSFLVLNVVRG
jgi:hypothetical protein